MSKIRLVIATEYRTRVMKKSFIILTLLMPILFAAVMFLPAIIASSSSETQNIALVDNTHSFSDVWTDSRDYDITVDINATVEDSAQAKCLDGSYDAVVIINHKEPTENTSDQVSVTIFSEKTMPSSSVKYIESRISDKITERRLEKITSQRVLAQIENAQCHIEATTIKCDEDGNTDMGAKAEVAMVIGMIATMIIYMFIFISGAQVMNAVMQEKTNRIVEVMLSAIKPWELMWGKLIAVALASLTQILIWAGFSALLMFIGSLIIGFNSPEMMETMNQASSMQQMDSTVVPTEILSIIDMDWTFIIVWFLLYFVAGYFLYSSMFAAMGAAVDNEADTQQFMLPITAIVLFALYAGIFSAENPDGQLAFWCSMIPFTSPIVMMVRLPFGVAWWELALSFSILILSVIAMAWICSKIYRVGILMYGKKASWKELWKWLKY